MKCYIDKHGLRAASIDGPLKSLGDFFVVDVISTSYAATLIQECEKIKNDKKGYFEATGNAHTVCISFDKVSVQCEYDDNINIVCRIEDFKRHVEIWFNFLLSLEKEESHPPNGPRV